MSQDLKDFLDRASRAPHAPHDPLPAIYRRHRRHRRRVIAGSTAAAVAGALLVGGITMVQDQRPTDPAQSVRTAGTSDVVVSVPDGWTVDETTQGCATTPRTIMVLPHDVDDYLLGKCLNGINPIPADVDIDTFEPKHHEPSTLPVAYVIGDNGGPGELMWSGDDLVLGSRWGEDVDGGTQAGAIVDLFTGATAVSRTPRAKGIGWALVLAPTTAEADAVMDQLDPRYPDEPSDGRLDPPAPEAQLGFSFTPREPGPDGGYGYLSDTSGGGERPHVPGNVVDGSVAAEARNLLVGLDPASAADARCLVVRIGDVDRRAAGTSLLWIEASIGSDFSRTTSQSGLDLYTAWIGTSDCPYIVDNWGGIAKRPPDLLNRLAELTLSPENLALFRQEWGPQGP